MNNGKIIPYGRQFIDEDDIKAVNDVLRSNFLTQGDKVPEFENAISNIVNSKFSVAANSATSVLHIACLALGVGKDDIVWTSSISFLASANCAIYCGAKVDFVDIDLNSGLMDVNALENKLLEASKKGELPKVLIPVHLSGASCNMKKIHELSKIYKFSIIEDASHALGGKYLDSEVGSCKFSDICVFSFHPVKIICTGEGGVGTTNSYMLYELMQKYRSHGVEKNPSKMLSKDSSPWIYEQQLLGFNYRMTDIQAALGLSQLKKLDKFVKKRNEIYQKYRSSFSANHNLMADIPEGVTSSVHLSIAILKDHTIESHKRIFEEMRRCGVWVQLHYSPIHLQPFYVNLGFKKGYLPNSESYAHKAISLPTFPSLKSEDQEYVIEKFKNLALYYN